MKKIKRLLLISLTLVCLNGYGQLQNVTFKKIYKLVEQKNFFKASETYDAQKDGLTTMQQKIIGAFLDNAFNRTEASNEKITQLIQAGNDLPDSLMLKLYKTKEDNSTKLFDYRGAKDAIHTIVTNYQNLLTDEDRVEMENSLKIWTALEQQPKQRVIIKNQVCLKMEKDKVGLNNLKVSSGYNTVSFIFDTGANLSVTSETTARQLGMKIIPVDIEVGTITGEKAPAQLAVCPVMMIGNIEIRNAVFLVLTNDGLTFSQIGYTINGILGYPVIEALNEIQTTRDGHFIVPKIETKFDGKSNLAMAELTPLVLINNQYFSFDTGADNTILYPTYFYENRRDIESNYTETSISFGGAAGTRDFKGYKIDAIFNCNGKNVALKNVPLLTKCTGEEEKWIYGNIGQDLIQQFEKVILNFNRMFIKFD